LSVSRITVRRAVRALVDEGLLNQQQGAGTFVSSPLEQPLSSLTSYTEDMTARGVVPGSRWLDRSISPATPDEVAALNLRRDAQVARLYRLRTANDRSLCLEHAVLPSTYLPDPECVDVSLYALLSERGIRPVKARQTLRAELFNIEQARLLAVPPGNACLYIERLSFLADGTPIEFVTSHYRGDSYSFVVDLKLEAMKRQQRES
jgi:GntR family transcriptional regulator